MKTFLKKAFITFFFFLSISAFAADSPVSMLQSVTDQMLSALQKTQNRNTQSLYKLVKVILLPHVDLDLMSQEVLGSEWTKATPAQRAQFKEEFTYFVTRTYSTGLSSYTNEKVRFFPIRGGVQGNRVKVNSAIDQENGQSVSVSYRLVRVEGVWKLYDFSVESVDLVENYRAQFVSVLRKEGMDGLIRSLKAHNTSHKTS